MAFRQETRGVGLHSSVDCLYKVRGVRSGRGGEEEAKAKKKREGDERIREQREQIE